MADNLASYKVFCAGGLNTSRDVLSQGETQPGSAITLINYEPAVTGGYRKISGYSNDYGTIGGTGNVLGVAVVDGIHDGIFGARKPSSGNNYLHRWNPSGDGSWVAINSSLVANDRDGVCAAQTTSGSANLVINGTLHSSNTINFTTAASLQPRKVTIFSAGGDVSGVSFTITGTDYLGTALVEIVTGPAADATVTSTNFFNTITQIAAGGAVTGNIEVGSGAGQYRPTAPTMTGVTKVRFLKYNWSGPKIILTDGINPAATYDGSNYIQVTDSNAPNSPKFSASFANHMFLAGDPTDNFNLYFSAPLSETDFLSANGAGVINVGFPIVAIKAFRDQLYIFGTTNIKRLEGNNLANFTLKEVTDDLGCMASDSIIEVGGDLLFLSQDGLRPISGTAKIGDVNLETVSKDIQSIFTDLVFSVDLEKIDAVVIRQKTQFRIFLGASDGQGVIGGFRQSPNGLQFEYGQMLGIFTTCAASGYVDESEFVIHGDSGGKVHRQEQGNDFDGEPIFSIFQTPFFHMQDPEQRKIFYTVATYLRSEGDNEIVMSVLFDYEDVDTLSPSNFTLVTQGAAAYFNEALYDSTAIFDGNPAPVRRTNISGSGKSAAIKYVTNDTNASHSVQGIVITFGVGDRL
mgnify:FL=1